MEPTTTRVDAWRWMRQVFGWDGLLPAGIALLPVGIDLLCPNATSALTVAAVVAPIAAVFARFAVGRRHLAANRVGPVVRACQWAVFMAAIFWLCLLDCFLIIVHVAPAVPAGDLIVLTAGYGLYFAAMTFAMYPGRAEHRVAQPEDQGVDP